MIFEHLLARQTHRHEAAPEAVFVTGWDDRIGSQVCWAVVNAVPWFTGIARIRRARRELTWELNAEQVIGEDIPTWLYGMAYVTVGSGYHDVTNDLESIQITAAEYAAIATDAT